MKVVGGNIMEHVGTQYNYYGTFPTAKNHFSGAGALTRVISLVQVPLTTLHALGRSKINNGGS